MTDYGASHKDIANGIFRPAKGGGFLHDPAGLFTRGERRVFVPQHLVQKHRLVEGATISGPIQSGKKGPRLAAVDSAGGLTPEAFAGRTPFDRLVSIDPNERFDLSATSELSTRAVDLIAPIGKGTRAMIVSPPKAGKTMLLEQIGQAIQTVDPSTRIIALLLDERPEEVTHFRRSVVAEVYASSADQAAQQHVALTELMMGHIRVELECGRDVVVLLDSLTRMGRAFNLAASRGGRTLSGGLDVGALQVPRRFFGLARNIEHGGSITILATALIDTGSRMDQLIFEEFKGTGNSEIVLDRLLAQSYIFPAINIAASGTRKDHLLYPEDAFRRLALLRRGLAGRSPKESMGALLRLLQKHSTNHELLQSIPLA